MRQEVGDTVVNLRGFTPRRIFDLLGLKPLVGMIAVGKSKFKSKKSKGEENGK